MMSSTKVTGIEAATIEEELKEFDIKIDEEPKQSWSFQITETQAKIDKFNKTTKPLEGSTGNIADNKKEVDRVIKRTLPTATEVDDNECKIKMSLKTHFSCDKKDAKVKLRMSGDAIKDMDIFYSVKLKLEINLIITCNSEIHLTYTNNDNKRCKVQEVHPNKILEVKFVKLVNLVYPDDGDTHHDHEVERRKNEIKKKLENIWNATCIETAEQRR